MKPTFGLAELEARVAALEQRSALQAGMLKVLHSKAFGSDGSKFADCQWWVDEGDDSEPPTSPEGGG